MKKTEIAFRKATEKDIKAVYDLICDMEAKQLDFDSFAIIFRKQLSNDDYYCLLCTEEYTEKGGAEGCDVIGELNLRFEDQLHHAGRIAEIMEFCIAAGKRNAGIGKMMLLEAYTIAKASGCIQIEVACNQLRKDTHRFYEREGMKNYHFKFSLPLTEENANENKLGR